jgi:hypothetical protein
MTAEKASDNRTGAKPANLPRFTGLTHGQHMISAASILPLRLWSCTPVWPVLSAPVLGRRYVG